jgi:hypothetical protein
VFAVTATVTGLLSWLLLAALLTTLLLTGLLSALLLLSGLLLAAVLTALLGILAHGLLRVAQPENQSLEPDIVPVGPDLLGPGQRFHARISIVMPRKLGPNTSGWDQIPRERKIYTMIPPLLAAVLLKRSCRHARDKRVRAPAIRTAPPRPHRK